MSSAASGARPPSVKRHRFLPSLWTRAGITRRVFITARFAVKVPRLCYGPDGFMRGCLANRSERLFSGFTPDEPGQLPPNPVLWSAPAGLLNVYRRALRYDGPIDGPMFGIFGDPKGGNVGVVPGLGLVLVDYDMHCSCWRQCQLNGLDVSAAVVRDYGDENDLAELDTLAMEIGAVPHGQAQQRGDHDG